MMKLLLNLTVVLVLALPVTSLAQAKSACGDVNDDGTFNITDLTYMIDWLYFNGPPPPDPSAADMDLCPGVDLGDIDYYLNFLFFGGPAPCVGPTDCTPYPAGMVTLSHVGGEVSPGVISTGIPIVFYIRFINTTDSIITAVNNGFRIYSPDGATWPTTTVDTLNNPTFDLIKRVEPYGPGGDGDDLFGYIGMSLSGGMEVAEDAMAFSATIGPFDAADEGKTICIDSSFFGNGGAWMWSVKGKMRFAPIWAGPHCFTIAQPPPGEASVSLDHVSGYSPSNNGLWSDVPLTYHLRMTNMTGYAVQGFTNGFRLYSPDGATWQPAVGDTTALGWWDRFELHFETTHHSCDGFGADTVGFGGVRMVGPGLEDGFDNVSLLIHTEVDGAQEGKVLCLDSAFYPPSGYWLWALESTAGVIPAWDGPHCFEILGVLPSSGDSLVVPSVTVETGNMVQPVHVKLTQPIKGASIPLKIPVGVAVDSLSRVGLQTENWDYTFSSVEPDSGFLYMALANSMGASIPTGEHALFNIHFKSLNAECDVPSLVHWDTALSHDPVRNLLFADVDGLDVEAGFDRERDVTEVPPYTPGDMDGSGTVDIGDLVYMVDFMFNGGPPPAIMNSMDVNGSCTGPNIADLVYFVDYFFQGGAAPVCGCLGEGGPKIAINETITMAAVYENGSTAIVLEAPEVLRGLEVRLVGETVAEPVNLMGDRLDLLYGFVDDRLRIGLLDLDGSESIEAGIRKIVEIPGRWEIGSALVAADGRRAQGVLIKNAFKGAVTPSTYTLHQNYPNPFNPDTQIDFSLPVGGLVKLAVYNVMGQKVAELVNGHLEAGAHSAVFDGSNTASGVYFYRLETTGYSQTRKMMLLK
ncbi:MAG: T9SS type A sorting domain-containing protein [candidate division Zixibacteria bacterium]|nr:T9SS type A sorting domain-containing protein [candidate division Zixibacteria bacterium]MDH3936729.1 T9SS type A sorting domain-containing protein [candidate division Zixibacteria bacterium]MDH4032686.1 T9SS type A sorting domain-containing protein [candidate division Zixibacteria bacterium]